MLKNPIIKLFALLSLTLTCSVGWAETYPNKPVRLIVPAATGGVADTLARLVGKELTDAWGQPVVVDNRPGASGIIGTTAIARAAPDGYTLGLIFTGALSINPALYRGLPYDANKDFAPVTLVSISPYVIGTSSEFGFKSLQEFVAAAKQSPGKMTYGSAGVGSGQHLAMAAFAAEAGIDLLHVPYKGSAAALTDMLAGRISVLGENVATVTPFIKDGKITPLAAGGAKRIGSLPDLPTVAESGYPGFEVGSWYGLVFPAGVEQAIIDQVHDAVRDVIAKPEINDVLRQQGLEPQTQSPVEFRKFILKQQNKWTTVIEDAKIPLQELR